MNKILEKAFKHTRSHHRCTYASVRYRRRRVPTYSLRPSIDFRKYVQLGLYLYSVGKNTLSLRFIMKNQFAWVFENQEGNRLIKLILLKRT